MTLIFLDTETTGLDPARHEIWEMAYAVNDGEIQSAIVPHSLGDADGVALEIGGYHRRSGSLGLLMPKQGNKFETDLKRIFEFHNVIVTSPSATVLPEGVAYGTFSTSSRTSQVWVRREKSATLVAANAAFDAGMLLKRWTRAPWHYRLLDVEAYAMGVLGWDEVKGLKDVCEAVDVEPGNHSAAGDVRAMRDAFYKLRDIAQSRALDS